MKYLGNAPAPFVKRNLCIKKWFCNIAFTSAEQTIFFCKKMEGKFLWILIGKLADGVIMGGVEGAVCVEL